MLKTIISSTSLVLILLTPALAQKLDPPKLTPIPSTEAQDKLIKEGVALHDQRNYDGAIAKYEEVLRENPDNVTALYELSFSYSLKKDYRRSLETAYKGAQYKSDDLAAFYMMIGNNLDVLGEPKKAVETYEKAIKLKPADSLAYYNLAITYSNLQKPEDAKKNLKKAVLLNPDHASSHLALSALFFRTNYKTPALLAVSRFLILEPRSERSVSGFKIIQEILGGGVKQGNNPNEMNIFLDLSAKKDEGDFGHIDLVMGLSKAAGMSDKNKGKTEVQLLVEQVETLFAILVETDAKGDRSKFMWQYYIPYFVELKKKNLVEPFTYYISQRSNLAGVTEWLAANSNRVNEFLNWSKQYPRPKVN